MPFVSIVVPCYNEQSTIRLLLEAVYHQTYPRSEMEVILADGMSSDGTRERVADFQREHPDLDVHVIDNPKRIIPAALNCALAVAGGEIIIRLDAHAVPREDYVACCVAALEAGQAENVGGVWEIRPGREDWVARSIAVAAAHPLGVGDALYRYASLPGYVDTVPFGAFRKATIDRLGWFDETLLTNEDYEFNARLRQSGGRVWLDPAIRSTYFARPTLAALAKQYFRYGFWKWRMLRRYPATLRWRQALPPLFVLSLVALALASIWLPLARWLLLAEAILYLAVLLAGVARPALKNGDLRLLAGVPAAIAVMHISWGSGFLWSLFRTGRIPA